MKSRQVLAAALAVPLLVGVSGADAATKKKRPPPPPPVCNLVVDAKEDAKGTGTSVEGQNESTLDIVGADIATNAAATTLNVVFRMAAVDATPSTAALGRGWDLSFTVKGQSVVVRSYAGPTGEEWADGAGSGKVDAAKKEVRVMVPVAKLSMPFKPGDKITDIRATSWRYAANDMVGKADHGDAVKPYVAGQRSCIAVGTV